MQCQARGTAEVPGETLWGGEEGGGGSLSLSSAFKCLLRGICRSCGEQDTGRRTWVPILLYHLGSVASGLLPVPHSVFYKTDVTAPTQGAVVRMR